MSTNTPKRLTDRKATQIFRESYARYQLQGPPGVYAYLREQGVELPEGRCEPCEGQQPILRGVCLLCWTPVVPSLARSATPLRHPAESR